MKKSIKKLWLKALRSGKYKQGKGALRDEDNFCCLGVLCDLHNKQTKQSNWISYEPSTFEYFDKDDTLPEEVIEWAGLPDHNPVITINNNNLALAEMNDGLLGKAKSFKQIANIIEKHL